MARKRLFAIKRRRVVLGDWLATAAKRPSGGNRTPAPAARVATPRARDYA